MDGKYLIRVGLSKGAHVSQPGDIDTLADRTPEEIQYHLAQGHIVIEPAPLGLQGKSWTTLDPESRATVQGKPHPVEQPPASPGQESKPAKKRSEP